MDINSIRKRLNQLQTTNNRTSNLWKPQPGKQVIRVLPYKHNKDNPFIELFFHFGLNIKPIFHQSHMIVLTQLKSLLKNLKQVGTEKSIRWLVSWNQR